MLNSVASGIGWYQSKYAKLIVMPRKEQLSGT